MVTGQSFIEVLSQLQGCEVLQRIFALMIVFFCTLVGCTQTYENSFDQALNDSLAKDKQWLQQRQSIHINNETDRHEGHSITEALIGDRILQASLADIDDVMKEMGWEKYSKVLGQFRFKDEQGQTVNEISVDKKAFKKDDYMYVVISLDSPLPKLPLTLYHSPIDVCL
ncbi:MAG: hypothetical protein H0Z39_11565 [Peptococcaceae bacterium]|nr:hypothetical protein [Peptococcaceae bacterium]